VLGKFLLDIETEISKNSLRFLFEFIINMKNGLNQIQGDRMFTKNSSAAELPLMMNTLFTEIFKKID